MLHAVDKEFSLCANYPKGNRDIFHECIDIYNPGALLLSVKRLPGSCQDLSVEGAGAVYTNRPYGIYYSDDLLKTTGDNILK